MLEGQADLPSQPAERQPNGHWLVRDVPLEAKGWWAVDVSFRGTDVPSAATQFYLMLPDPTLVDGERDRPTDQRALEVYKDAIKRITELKSMRVEEELSDGIGNSIWTDYEYLAPDKLRYSTKSGYDSIAIGGTQYYRDQGGPWRYRPRLTPFSFPAGIPSYYSGATGFTLGRQEVVDGEVCQIITFYVPEIPGRDESWYAWWVGTESKLVRREAMIARYHYMTGHYLDHDAPIQITAPEGATPMPE
jgi:copper transport protein